MQAFTLTWHSSADEEPIVGRGSDSDLLAVGIFIKAISYAARPRSAIVRLTHRFNKNVEPGGVPAPGGWDLRLYELVGYVILPHQTEKHFSEAFAMLHHLYTQVTNKQISVRYVMADADKGQRKAVNGALGDGNELVNLMCYY